MITIKTDPTCMKLNRGGRLAAINEYIHQTLGGNKCHVKVG